MNLGSIVIALMRDWGTDPIFLLVFTAIPLLWMVAFRSKSKRRSRLLSRSWAWIRRAYAAAWLMLVLVFTAPAIVNPLVDELEQRYPLDSSCLANSPIVVLGAGVSRRATPVAPIVVSGAGVHSVSEGAMMQAYLQQNGVASARIAAETRSMNTRENALNVSEMMREQYDTSEIRLVTSAMHMPRAMGVFQAVGLQPCAVPVDHMALQNVPWYTLAPQSSAMHKFDKYLHERIGSWLYRRNGWFETKHL